MSGEFYPTAEAFNPRPRFRDLLRGPLTVRGLLWVALTDKRLGFGTTLFYTWRIIQVASITKIAEIHERWPYRNALLVEYTCNGRAEALVVYTRSAEGRQLAKVIQGIGAGADL